MSTASDPTANDRPLERFKPTSGLVVGYVGMALMALLLVYVLVSVHTITGLRLGLAAVFCGILVWVTQLRPRVTAYSRHLVLHSSLTDTHLPLALVDDVTVRHTLNVWVGERRYVCIGIGMPRRRLLKNRGHGASSFLGFGAIHDAGPKADTPALDQSGMPYDAFVVQRIEQLVNEAKRSPEPAGRRTEVVRRHVAWPEVIGLAVSAFAFVVTLFL